MNRRKKSLQRRSKTMARRNEKYSQNLGYDPLEPRQVLTAGVGFNAIGATLGTAGITSQLPNAEGDVNATHYVEVGEQTFTVFERADGDDATLVESTSLNQFFIDAGANLFGDTLEAPRVIYDRAIDRWFVAATGAGEGNFAGNRIHVAFSQTSDPSGQWQQLDFVTDITGVLKHTNVSFGVDADGVYFATQNLNDDGNLVDVSIYSIPKADLFLPNPTLNALTRHDNLSIFDYGRNIQFASNFEASDGSVLAFSAKSVDLNEGTPLPPNERLTPGTLNAFRIEGADAVNANLTESEDVDIDSGEMEGPFVEPDPMFQPSADGNTMLSLSVPSGLNMGLIESNGSVFGAQTIGFDIVPGMIDTRSNGINWFELDTTGATPAALQTQVILDRTFFIDQAQNVDFVTDPDNTLEQGAIDYYNPSIAISDAGLVALTFNGSINFEAANFGILDGEQLVTPEVNVPFDLTEFRISSYVAVGLRVQGAIQMENFSILNRSTADGPFDQTPSTDNLWGRYSSVRPDPSDPNSLFSVIANQTDNGNQDNGWTVALTEITPIELEPIITGTSDGDLIVISLDPVDTDFVQVTFDGVVEYRAELSLLNLITVDGAGGNDTFIVDYTFGDPTPPLGLELIGGGGFDSLETRTLENVDFQIRNQVIDVGDFSITTENGFNIPVLDRVFNTFVEFETLVGGSGDDLFNFVNGVLAGDVSGEAGDDRFVFTGAVRTGGSVNGGTGFNTLDLTDRIEPTDIQLFSASLNQGFNGRTLNGPIGEFNQVLDQFRDISLVRGSTFNENDSIQALNQFVANYTIVSPDISPFNSTPATADSFVASTLEQNGAMFYFMDFDTLSGSVLDDVFDVQSNDGAALSDFTLEGRTGNDVFNFSSDAPNNLGVLADIGGLFTVDGGEGDNSLVVSDAGRLGPDEFLVLGARISGPVEIIFFSAGTFDVTLFGSDNLEPDTFFLQSFLDQNTLNVFGLGGDDTFVIQDLSQAEVIVNGGEGDDDYIIEQVGGIDNRDVEIVDSIDSENDQAIIAGTILDEVFVVDADSFVSENFTFVGIEEFGFDGRGGNDEFYVQAIDEEFPVILRGGLGDDQFFVSSDAPINLGTLEDINNNLTIEDQSGSNQILISNEAGPAKDVEIFNEEIIGLFSGVLNYTGVFDLIEIIGSNGGNDRFVITSFLANNSLRIDGRLGEDEFVIGNENDTADILGDIQIDGASDGDTYTLFLTSLQSQNITIEDTGFSGNDVLDIQATLGIDNITLSEFEISTVDQSIQVNEFFETIMISTLAGDDNIVVMNAPADTIILDSGEGNDNITVGGTVGVSQLDILGGAGMDSIQINESSQFTTSHIDGGSEADSFFIDSNVIGDVDLMGGTESDSYEIELAQSGNRTVNIIDTDNDLESHTIRVTGTSNAETVTLGNTSLTSINEGINFDEGLFDLFTLTTFGGDDQIHVTEASYNLNIFGGNGADAITLASAAPIFGGNVDGITGVVAVDGGGGRNQLNISNETGTAGTVTITNDTITGLTANPITFVGRFDLFNDDIGGIHILGSDLGDDVFDVVGVKADDSLRVYGLGGNDTFNINNGIVGDARFDGGEDSDTYNFQFGSNAEREIVIQDTGTTGSDLLNLSGSNGADNIVLTPTSISDAFTTLSFNIALDAIEIDALGGNDIFTVNGAPNPVVSLSGNQGNDSFIINGTAGINDLNLFGNNDSDSFVFNSVSDMTRIDAHGGSGNETFRVEPGAQGRLFLDGENGSDSYNVFIGSQGERRVVTQDSGDDAGHDTTTVTGTSGSDRVAVRTTRFLHNDEIIVFDQNTESIALNTADGNDRIVFFGSRSPLSEVFAGAGNDTFVVNGGSSADVINLQGQSGDDTFNVNKTSAGTTNNLFGNSDNDRFNIGSTANADDGNLGLIRGTLNIFGGSDNANGEDRLFANDNGAAAPYSYRVTPNEISPIAGPANLPRENFAGINFDASTEFVRLDGTQAANLIQVTASPTTRFFFDGNNPTGNVGDRLTVVFQANDGRNLSITDPQAGDGFVTFTNGNEIIQFEDIELPNLGTAGTAVGLPMDEFFSTADMDDLDDVLLI